LPVRRREHQRRLSVLVGDVGVRSGFEQHAGHFEIGNPDRFGQRARAVFVDGLCAGAFLEQRRDELAIDAVHGPVQRSRPVDLRLVDVHALGDHRQRGSAVAGLNPIRER
jgi:hypothetical protein